MTPRTTGTPAPAGTPAAAVPTTAAPAAADPKTAAKAAGKAPRTTPYRVRLLAVFLVVTAVLTAAMSWLRVDRAGAETDALRDRHLPAVVALDQVAEALTEADRAAARALVSGAFPLTGPGTDYQEAVKIAGQALADARERLGGVRSAQPELRAVDGLIIEYAGLVGVAQSGGEGPLAVAGIVYASDLLHAENTGILARLGELRDAELAALRDGRDGFWTSAAATVPFRICAGAVFLVLVVGMWYLRRRFHRHVNPFLVVAMAALLALVVWDSVNASRTQHRVDEAAGAGATRVTELWQARTDVHRVVGAESLALVTRGLGQDHRADADAALRELAASQAVLASVSVPGGDVVGDIAAMRDTVAALRAQGFGPQPATDADQTPQNPATVRLLLGSDGNALTGLAVRADTAFTTAAAEARQDTEHKLAEAGSDQGLGIAVPLLGLAMVLPGAWGFWLRYREYWSGG
ncbi:hypothetical protein LO772_09010 [Yinghuangia sp. ASG 101]|uniref:hypothetical protein n=1 Tax=Yinghuangia sp. ASG 101 TaxID=2896848 RepID=UPI001E368CAD|nr:hypothetical protein [Yinghuangia sp. ASG 101]UGQ13717.1 hypothetical protein LO772_09010 [Yinghuangia sp. ASG 101]